MSKRDFYILILFFIAILVGLYMLRDSAMIKYHNEVENLSKFESNAKSLANLKRKFNKKNYEKVIKNLNRISPASKDFKKSDTRVLVFENLAASTLANMIRKIENSTLLIKKLEITRLSDENANLRLELYK